jgi:hypothetical protein
MGLDMYLTRKIYFGGEYEHRNISFGNLKENEEKLVIKQDIVNYQTKEVVKTKTISLSTKDINRIESRVGYWRKANAIHKWFVDNVQNGEDDCSEYYVSKEKLIELYDTCIQVMAIKEKILTYVDDEKSITDEKIKKDDLEKLVELLPYQRGFFFGSTNYDEYYFQDVEDTIEICNKCLNELKNNENTFMSEFYYQSSW